MSPKVRPFNQQSLGVSNVFKADADMAAITLYRVPSSAACHLLAHQLFSTIGTHPTPISPPPSRQQRLT